MLGIREFFCVGTENQKESKIQKGVHRAILSILEEGGIVEKQARKWYNSRMKGGHPCDEFS